MIDLNTLISNALVAAVQQATAPLNERIAALESDLARAVSVVEQRTERIAALETKLTEANLFTQMTPATPTTDITRHIIDALSDTEHPLFKRLSSFMDAVAEQAMDDHTSTYDHDDYDSAVSKLDDMPDLDDYVTRDSVREEIEDVINNATISIRA